MTKKEKTPEEILLDESTLCTLKAEDYWEWRTTMEEIEHAKTSHSLNQMKLKLMEAQGQILRMEMALFRQRLSESSQYLEKCKEDYLPFKSKLEDKYNISLKNASIRDDFRVVALPENNQGGKDGTSKTI